MWIRVIAFISSCLFFSSNAWATDYYVAPHGTPSNDGTINSPWDLQTALLHPSKLQPGDTINLRGGTYLGRYTATLVGEEGKPITVRSYPGEWAILDGLDKAGDVLAIKSSSYAWFMNFEVTSSNGARVIPIDKSHDDPDGGLPVGVSDVDSNNCKIINLVIHDTALGVGSWRTSSSIEYYGNVIYNIGWDKVAPDRIIATGHAIYVQGQNGIKKFEENMIFGGYGYLVHGYGTSRSGLDHLQFERNIIFSPDQFEDDRLIHERGSIMLIGGGITAQDCVVEGNMSYIPARSNAGGFYLGYNTHGANNCRVENNYFFNSANNIHELSTNIEVNNNFFGGRVDYPAWPIKYPNNEYRPRGEKPTTNVVKILPNKYDSSKATIVIYNWEGRDKIDISLPSGLFPANASYELINVQDYFNDRTTGTLAGSSLSVSTTNRTIALMQGSARTTISTFPEFGVFIIKATQSDEPDPDPDPDDTTSQLIDLSDSNNSRGFATVNSSSAYGASYLQTTSVNTGVIEIPFDVEVSDEYYIMARVTGANASSDSFFVSVDNGQEDVFDTAEGAWTGDQDAFFWAAVNGRGGSGVPLTLNPRIFQLQAGTHVIRIRGRELGAKIDAIVVESDLSKIPNYTPPIDGDDSSDFDGDGVADREDNCPNIPNPDQANFDGDSRGDVCDSDDDNDGVDDLADCNPRNANAWRTTVYFDTDQDGYADQQEPKTWQCFGSNVPLLFTTEFRGLDNCPGIANPGQSDIDRDGIGDACAVRLYLDYVVPLPLRSVDALR